jgi:hypothetical protein
LIGRKGAGGALTLTGGLLGALAGYAILKTSDKLKDPLADVLTDLPDPVRQAADWPVDRTKSPVIFVRKQEASTVSYPSWGGLRVTTGQHQFTASVDIFSRSRVLRFLRQTGWGVR